MARLGLFACVLLCALPACHKPSRGGGAVALETEHQKTLYALGVIVGRNVASLKLAPDDVARVVAGLDDAAANRPPRVALADYAARVRELGRTHATTDAAHARDEGKAYAEAAAKQPGAERTPSGLVFQSLRAGSGPTPTRADTVKVSYRGTLVDGTEFDGSKQPAELPLAGVIPCWTEGLQKMKVGGKARLICPAELAYGDAGRPPRIPGGATLVFDVELLGIVK